MACKSVKINVTLDLEWVVYDGLQAEAGARGVPISVVIRDALRAQRSGRYAETDVDSSAECRNILEGIIQALTTPLEEEEMAGSCS